MWCVQGHPRTSKTIPAAFKDQSSGVTYCAQVFPSATATDGASELVLVKPSPLHGNIYLNYLHPHRYPATIS